MAGVGGNGGWSSDGGSADDLPDLPPEWGVIVIPDDLSELDDEVRAVRAELRAIEHPSRWQLLMRRPGMRWAQRLTSATLRAPVLIITMAVLVTLASLFASAWPGPPRQPATQRTAATERMTTLPALEMFDTTGRTVPLRDRLPAVILVIDGCETCATLVADTVAAVRPEIAVITVSGPLNTSSAPGTAPAPGATPPAQGKTVRALHDPSPTGDIRAQLKLPGADGTAAVLLVRNTGEIVRTIPRTASVKEFTPDLARL